MIFSYNGLGQRVSQTVSSVVTEYLLDVQPGLWKVIAADDGSNVNRYIHDPVRGRIFQHEDPTGGWNWPALDGLGIVRGVYDDTLTEVYAADRDPYGDLIAATGSNPTPFEYTGEPEDPNGLLHLRARYYDPVLAAFNNLDPAETPNRYAYANGNPVTSTDPSGLSVGWEGSNAGNHEYSCNCGWIDWSHVNQIVVARSIINALETASLSTLNPDLWGIEVNIYVSDSNRIPVVPEISLALFSRTVIIPPSLLEQRGVEALAVSIYMDAEFEYESRQGYFSLVSGSSFSEEDLVSDLLGFYLAKIGYSEVSQAAKSEIRSICGRFSKNGSGDVFRYTYEEGEVLATSYKQWTPRLLPLLDCSGAIDMSYSESGRCNRRSRQYPSELTSLVNSRILPADPEYIAFLDEWDTSMGGNWGWSENFYVSGVVGALGFPTELRPAMESERVSEDLIAMYIPN